MLEFNTTFASAGAAGETSPHQYDRDGLTQRLAFLGELRWKLGLFMGHDQTWPRFDSPAPCLPNRGTWTLYRSLFTITQGFSANLYFLHTLVLYYGCNSRFQKFSSLLCLCALALLVSC